MKRVVVDARTGEQTIIEREPTQDERDQSIVDQAKAQAAQDEAIALKQRVVAAVANRNRPPSADDFRALQEAVVALATRIGIMEEDGR